MESTFKALLLSYKQAGVALREEVALPDDTAATLLRTIAEVTGATDLLILSTCNRTELYYNHADDLTAQITLLLELQLGLAPGSDALRAFRRITDSSAAIKHLYRVALGLEAQIPGDMQVIHQVKQAYQLSADNGTAGPFLHRLLHTIFFSNKRVVTETTFRTGAASVSYAAQQLAEELLPAGQASRIVVLGVGEMGANLCRNLVAEGYTNLVVLNRTEAKAEDLAKSCGIAYGPLTQLQAELAGADAVISCVAAPTPVFTEEMLATRPKARRLLVLDLSVPRSVAAALAESPAVLLYDIDELSQRATHALQARLAEVPHVERILEEGMAEFADWSRDALAGPAIQRFKHVLEEMRRQELARYIKQLSPEQLEVVEKVTGALVQKIIKLPAVELKAACRRGEGEETIAALDALFGLRNTEEAQA